MEVKESAPKYDRWERIDGVIYDMTPPPSSNHQGVIGALYVKLHSYLSGRKCRVFVAPFGVWLDETEDGNYVEPDIVVICDKSKVRLQGCFGAPDMVVEVLSPSTARKDKDIKLHRYMKSGVREYWIVDPVNQYLEIHQLIDGHYGEPEVYGREDVARSGIFDHLEIHLTEVFTDLIPE